MVFRHVISRIALLTLIISSLCPPSLAFAQRTYLSRSDKENYKWELRSTNVEAQKKFHQKRTQILKERKKTLDELYKAMHEALRAAERSQHRAIKGKYFTEIKEAKNYFAKWEREARIEINEEAQKQQLVIRHRYEPHKY